MKVSGPGDRRSILELLEREPRLQIITIASRIAPERRTSFGGRCRVGYALGWLRRSGLVKREVISRGPDRYDAELWSITNLGQAVVDGRCSATVFRSGFEGRCRRLAFREHLCWQHAEAIR